VKRKERESDLRIYDNGDWMKRQGRRKNMCREEKRSKELNIRIDILRSVRNRRKNVTVGPRRAGMLDGI